MSSRRVHTRYAPDSHRRHKTRLYCYGQPSQGCNTGSNPVGSATKSITYNFGRTFG